MKYLVFGILDEKAQAFGLPFFQTTPGLAIRMTRDLVNDPKSSVSKYPSDFALYQLGTFDDHTGAFESLAPITMVNRCVDLVEVKQ